MLPRLLAATAALLCFTLGGANAQAPEAERALAREIYARIVSFDTSVEGRQTPQMANYLANRFRAGGFSAADVRVIGFQDTASLVVRYRGDGSGGRPILLLAHMDVVPARREDWERDPFTLTEADGFFYGRGAYDNKSGIALLSTLFLRMRAEGFTPTRDLILVFTADEETSGASARHLLSEHRALIDGEFALNSDGGGGELNDAGVAIGYSMQTAEKSYASYTLTARNPGGHSSLPRADNAIYDLSDALQRVREHEFPVMWNDTTLASMAAIGAATEGDLGQAMLRFARNPRDRRAAARLSREPSTVGQIRTTCVPTLLQAGHADNALPQRAVATVNCRIFPGVSIDDIRAELQRLAGNGVEVAQMDQYWSSDASPLRDDVTSALRRAVSAIHGEIPITPSMSAGATDGVFFRGAGIPTYGVGEVFIRPADDFAHGLNERIPVASFYNGLTYWRTMITAIAGRN